jgi:hypothetical protein
VRYAEWTDDRGRLRRSLVRDGDPDALAPQGLPRGVPDLGRLDWEAVERDLHNALHRRGLYTWEDVQRAQDGVTGAVLAALRRRVTALYREAHSE